MTTTQANIKRNAKTARLGLRATPEQEVFLRRAAQACHKSLTEFIMESAFQAAADVLMDQRIFMVSGDRYQALLDMLDGPVKDNVGLRKLFSKSAPWD